MTALWLHADRQRREKEQERDRANTARNELERAVYAGRIVLAQKAYQDNDIAMSRSLLNRARPEPGRPDLRGWEYWYLRHLCQADLHPGMRHTREGWNFIHSLAVSPDGRRAVTAVGLAVGQRDSQGRDRGSAPGEVHRLGPGNRPEPVAHRPRGGRRCRRRQFRRPPSGAGRRAGRRALARHGDGQAPEGAAAGRRARLQPGVLPSGRALAIASDRALFVWSLETDRERFTATQERPWSRLRIAFRPDGRLLLAVAPEVNDVRGWDPETGAEVAVPLRKEPAQALAFSPDGSLLALAPTRRSRSGTRPAGGCCDVSRPTRDRSMPWLSLPMASLPPAATTAPSVCGTLRRGGSC